ncbi:MAG TPA: hypothetical protein VK631_12010 [Solirubrobacteraceae bacterium]|nr:hypothetical protein [Solirubrobacteraceae bacterium]
MNTNLTPAPTTRVDFQIRVVADAESYAQVGQMMDKLASALRIALDGRARFDFTSFQTHPCKAAEMERLSVMALEPAVPYPVDPQIPGTDAF